MGSLSFTVVWIIMIIVLVTLLLIALVGYIIGYYWTLGRHRALLVALRDTRLTNKQR